MTVNPVVYGSFLLEIGDGASSETFAQPCLINGDKAVEITTTYSDDVIPDCDNPTAPAQVNRYPDQTSVTASGTGKLHQTDAKTYADWAADGSVKNCRMEVGTAGQSGAFVITCPMVCTGYSLRATRPTTVEVDLSFASHTFVPANIAALT